MALQFSLAVSIKPRQKRSMSRWVVQLCPGVCIGFISLALHVALEPLWRRPHPVWPPTAHPDGTFPPAVALALHTGLQYLNAVCLNLLGVAAASIWLPNSWALHLSWFGFTRLVYAAPAMLASVHWAMLPGWLLSQAIMTLFSSATFQLVYRHDFSQLPVSIATAMGAQLLQDWQHRASNHMEATLVTLCVVGAICEVLRRALIR